MNLLDKAISYVNPSAGLKRAQIRMAMDHIRKFDGASNSRRTKGWKADSTSANAELKNSLETLRNRSRDMVRNNSYAKTAIDVITTNTIGTGIRPSPNIKDENKKKAVIDLWNVFAKTCDFDSHFDFYGLQEIVMRTIAESGECLILKKVVKDGENLPLKLQVLEPDFISKDDDTFNLDLLNNMRVVQGVKFDKNGKRLGVYLYKQHPGDTDSYTNERVFVKSEDIIHIFKVERPGQARGLPWGSSALILLKDLADYQDATLLRQKIASCFSIFIEDTTTEPASGTTEQGDLLEKIEPGIIEYLPPNKKVTFAQPPSNDGYGAYIKVVVQSIASAYGVTYESISGDLGNINFSSGRMGWLEYQKRIVSWQYNLIVPQLCDVVWKWFIDIALLIGKINIDCTAEWTPARREMIDPVKEINGISLSVRNGLQSWQEAVRAQGYDPNQVAKEMSDDYKLFDLYGLKLDIDGRVVMKQGAAAPTESA